jgi:hypothetical protein
MNLRRAVTTGLATALVAAGLASATQAGGERPRAGGLGDESILRSPGGEHRSVTPAGDRVRQRPARAGGRRGSGTYLRGFAETLFAARDDSLRGFWFDQAARAQATVARLNLPWRSVTTGKPADPTNPADPAYSFAYLDRAVADAAARGQMILVTVYDAPEFAEGPNQSGEAPNGTWKPDPDDIADFAEAVATRYSGTFTEPGGAVLPAVQYLEAWNEPNLSDYLTPQYTRKSTFAGDYYRQMVRGFERGVRRAGGGMEVVAGVTAPYGDPQGGRRTRPLRFLRDFLCLDNDLKRRKGCGPEASFDILSHHPITLSGGPGRSAIHRDDAAMPDFHNVVDTLRAAERRSSVGGPNRHPVWATEFWWESDPPDGFQGVPMKRHARWIQEAQYSLWRQGAAAAIWLLLADVPPGPDGIAEQQSGLFFADGREKLSFTAFRFPLAGDRLSKRRIQVWTIPPESGQVEIQSERRAGFRAVETKPGIEGRPMQLKVTARGKTKLRAMVNGETSLTYTVK